MAGKRIILIANILLVSLFSILISCESKSEPRSCFTRTFPKRPCSLVEALGDSLRIVNPQGDTVKWNVFFEPNTQISTIVQESETLFTGWASRFRRHYYYLSTSKTDTTYRYDVLKIDHAKNQLQGFLGKYAMLRVDELIDNQKISEKFFPDKENFPYKLKPYRRAVHRIFTTILQDTVNIFQLLEAPPKHPEINEVDDVLSPSQSVDGQNIDHHLIQKIFPNPTKGPVNVVLHEDGNYTIKLVNSSGKVMSTVSFSGTEKQVDLSGLPAGIYHLQIGEFDGELEAVVKIVLE